MQTFNPTPLQNFNASNSPQPTPDGGSSDMQWSPHHQSMNPHNHKQRNRILILIVVVVLFIGFILILLGTGKSRGLSRLQANAYETTPAAMKTDYSLLSSAYPQYER